jgi:SAM-dependent methyltransferase
MSETEEQNLQRHWSGLSHSYLKSYLIHAEENPAINPQSVFLRGCIADRLFNQDFSSLINDEILFSTCACFALQRNENDELREIAEIISSHASLDNLPNFLCETIQSNEHQFDLFELVSEIAKCTVIGFEYFNSPFRSLWRNRVKGRSTANLKLLEIGCGSANDYRYWDTYGLADYIQYTGIDISRKNIENAKKLYPETNFQEANGCRLDLNGNAYEVVLCFDVLEHLSASGTEDMLNEMTRLSSDEIWISLFNGTLESRSSYQMKDDYHWNSLSLTELSEFLEKRGFKSTVMSISTELETRFEGYSHYNPNAYLLFGTKKADPPSEPIATTPVE